MMQDVSSSQILGYLALFVIWYWAVVRHRQYANLKHFKGPATTGISWWWYSKAVLSGRAHEYYGDVVEKYGLHLHRVVMMNVSNYQKDP